MNDQMPPINSVMPGFTPPVPQSAQAMPPQPVPVIQQMAPQPVVVPSLSTQSPVAVSDNSFTNKQIFLIIGLGIGGLVLGAGTAFLLNMLGVSLIGGQ